MLTCCQLCTGPHSSEQIVASRRERIRVVHFGAQILEVDVLRGERQMNCTWADSKMIILPSD